jgi:hypothetical protein
MEQFDDFLTPSEISNFHQYYINQMSCYMRLEITEFMLTEINDDDKSSDKYYDLEQFFKKYKIKHDFQDKIKNNIFSELKQLGWHIATIFGDTGLIIMKSEEHIKKSLWASSFDFNIQ